MKETLASVVSELEKAVRPLGFKIRSVEEIEKPNLIMSGTSRADNEPELSIVIVRKGKLD
jgi:hypothetical protein